MKLVDALWEKRNLGVDCLELHCDANDPVDTVLGVLPLRAAYQVVRVPAGRADLLLAVQDAGYRLIEMSIDLVRPLQDFEMPPTYKRFESSLSFREAQGDECERVLEIVASGNMFTTDRISLDPFFTAAQAGHRYACWSRELLQQGGTMYLAAYKGREIGFGINVERHAGVYDACLGGVFPGRDHSGLGFAPLYLNTIAPRQRGARKVVTQVSSNNLPILKLHFAFGYEPTGMDYVLIRHAAE